MVKAFKILRIVSCILAALCAAACIPMFIWFDKPYWGIVTVLVGVIFFVLMILFKRLQENAEIEDVPQAPRGDFITGPVKSDTPADEGIDKKDAE